MRLTEKQLLELAERISALGKRITVEDLMGALGLVLYSCIEQFPPDDRLQAVTAWCAALFRQIANAETKRKAN